MAFLRVEQRKDGPRWCVYYRDVQGHQRKQTFTDPKDADRYLADVEVAPQPSRMLFTDWWDRWDRDNAPKLTVKVANTYRRMGRRLLLPYFGRMPLSDIQRTTVSSWVSWASERAGAGTVQKAHVVLSSVLGLAWDLGLIQTNPAARMGRMLPKVKERAPRPHLTPTDVRLVADQVRPEFRMAIKTMGLLGLRPSEAIGLKVTDVDLDRDVLHVRRSVVDGVVGETKTKRDRAVPLMGLGPEFADHIRLWTKGNEILFTSPNTKTGSWIQSAALAKLVKQAGQRAGFVGVTAQGLRSIAESNIVELTRDVKFAQEVLGHASPVMTLNHYDRVTPNRQREAVARCSSAFQESAPDSLLDDVQDERADQHPAREQ